jgi:hypothetical protein
LQEYKIDSAREFHRFDDFIKNRYYETIFLDEWALSEAIKFYNSFMGYTKNPIEREEALAYARVGTRINADLFKTFRPSNEKQLDDFYRFSPFHFFNNIIRMMDGMHRNMFIDISDQVKGDILDFAGGTGGFSIHMASKGNNVTFIESNFLCLAWMRYISKRCGLSINIIESGSKIDGMFDFIMAKDVIEHVINPNGLYKYLTSMLKDKGAIYMTHYPCCGPDDLAPFHFKVGEGNFSDKKYFDCDPEANLEYLKSGKYPTKPSDNS